MSYVFETVKFIIFICEQVFKWANYLFSQFNNYRVWAGVTTALFMVIFSSGIKYGEWSLEIYIFLFCVYLITLQVGLYLSIMIKGLLDLDNSCNKHMKRKEEEREKEKDSVINIVSSNSEVTIEKIIIDNSKNKKNK